MYRYIRDILTKLSSLVRHNTGLLVSLCIATGILFLSGCTDDVAIYEVTSDAKDEGTKDGTIAEDTETAAPDTEAGKDILTAEVSEDKMLIVHLCGAVNNPGVYELKMDSRIIDGINRAGGFTEDASEDALNLAMELKDGSRIYVPTKEEVKDKGSGRDVSGSDVYVSAGYDETASDDQGTVVNINTASEDKLTTLSGIGISRAKAIIAYREEHGGFKSKEELMNISGIGQASFDKIKDEITL